jgi:hypothetical protein
MTFLLINNGIKVLNYAIFSPLSSYFLPVSSKYPHLHYIHVPSPNARFPQRDRPSFTHIKNMKNFSSLFLIRILLRWLQSSTNNLFLSQVSPFKSPNNISLWLILILSPYLQAKTVYTFIISLRAATYILKYCGRRKMKQKTKQKKIVSWITK